MSCTSGISVAWGLQIPIGFEINNLGIFYGSNLLVDLFEIKHRFDPKMFFAVTYLYKGLCNVSGIIIVEEIQKDHKEETT